MLSRDYRGPKIKGEIMAEICTLCCGKKTYLNGGYMKVECDRCAGTGEIEKDPVVEVKQPCEPAIEPKLSVVAAKQKKLRGRHKLVND